MWFFLCLIMFPLLMIVAISFRQGNFSVGDVIPSAQTSTLDHWRLALGLNVRRLNLVPGAQLTYVKTDDGAVRLSVASEEATGFRDFVSEPFSDQDVLKANEEQPLVVLAYPESLTEDANVYDANEAAAMSKAFAEKLSGMLLTIPVKVNSDGKIFGSVSAAQVVDALAAAGIEVDKKAVTVPEIKEAGEFEAAVKCYKNVVGNVKLNVIAE